MLTARTESQPTGTIPGQRQPPSDEALIVRIAKGDKLAMRALFAKHQVRLYRYVLRLVWDREMAEDVVSDVFLDVWRCAGRFEARSEVSTWLLGIGRYKALSAVRRVRAEVTIEAAAEVLDQTDDPEVATQKRTTGEILRQCLSGLSTTHSEIIDLVYYQEKSIKEIAEIVGIPENTVKTRVFHARKQLAKLLAAAGVDRGAA